MKPRAALCILPILAFPAGTALAAGPFQPEFRLSNFHAPLVIDNPYSPTQAGTRTVSYELEDGECKVNDVVVTQATKHDFHGAYAGLSARTVTDKVWSDPHCNGKRVLLLEDTLDWYGQDNGGRWWAPDPVPPHFDQAGRRRFTSQGVNATRTALTPPLHAQPALRHARRRDCDSSICIRHRPA
jgi:hypothetical protein